MHPSITDHQHRVTYISIPIARQLGLEANEQRNLFHAAAFHDIGLIYPESRVSALLVRDFEKVHWHPEAGFELLKDIPAFKRAAKTLRYHHVSWSESQQDEGRSKEIPLSSHILVLADAVELAIERDAYPWCAMSASVRRRCPGSQILPLSCASFPD